MARALDNQKRRDINNKEEYRYRKFKMIKNSYFLSGILTGLVGTGDEIYQHFIPGRFFTLYDVFLNLLGGTDPQN